jgi:putative membrane protein
MSKKIVLTVGLIALGLILATAVIFCNQPSWGMGTMGLWHGNMMGGSGMMGFGLLGFLFMFLFWGGIIALAVWLVSLLFPGSASDSTTAPGSGNSPGPSALETLKLRYAHGELSRDEYQQMIQDLEQ